jgi:hypothetical protein
MGNPVSIDDIINYELPRLVVEQVQVALPAYWEQLKQDDGNQKWVERLAKADIRPLKIQGSSLFDEGLVDPDIIDCLDRKVSFL